MNNDRITIEQERINNLRRRGELAGIMADSKSIPEYLLAAAEYNALQARKEIQKLKDILRKHPDANTENALMQIVRNELAVYEVDIAEMREFYGK